MLWAPISTQKKQKLWPKGFPGDSDSKKSACHTEDPGSIPGSGRSPGEVNGNPLQYSCLENFMDREAWQATGHGIAELDMTKCLTLSFSSFMTWWNLNQKQGKLRTDLECIVYSQRVIVSLNVYLAELYKVLFSTQPRHLKIWQPVHKLCVCVCVHVCLHTNKMHLNIGPFRIATLGGSIYGIVIVQPFLSLQHHFINHTRKSIPLLYIDVPCLITNCKRKKEKKRFS